MTEMSPKLEKFCNFYSIFDVSNIDSLHEFYTDEAIFKDPVHELEGIEAMRVYIADLCAQVSFCNFVFHQHVENGDRAFLRWTMRYAHPKVLGGKSLELDGCTEIEFIDDRVCYHCDYYDMGAMLYEHLPVIGAVIRWLRKRLA